MKKMIVFLKPLFLIVFAILIILTTVFAFKFAKIDNFEDVLSLFSNYEKVTIVSKESTNDLKVPIVKNGNLNYLTYYSNHRNYLNKNMDCEGLVFYFSLDLSLDYFQKKLNYNLSSSSLIENYNIYQGYTSLFKDFIILKGKKINVQLAKTKSAWVLGFPVILTGF